MPRLNLVMIVRNEARCIQRCLASAAPHVDRMIVVDTGSSDATIDLAERSGATVHSAEWQDDFSRARNLSLSLSDADFNLVLDADEWIEDHEPWHRMRSSLSAQAPLLGIVRIQNLVDLTGCVEVTESWLPRLLPRGASYQGRIHEQVVSSRAAQRLAVTVRHDGYRHGHAVRKHERNMNLLQEAIAQQPNDAYLRYQLGCQFEVLSNWPMACEQFAVSRQLGGLQLRIGLALGVRNMYALSQCKRFEEALQLGIVLRSQWPDSSDVHFTFGNLCLDVAAADPSNALVTWLPAAQSSWLLCLEIGEEGSAHQEHHVIGRGGHLAAHNLAVTYREMGKASEADEYAVLATNLKKRLDQSRPPTLG